MELVNRRFIFHVRPLAETDHPGGMVVWVRKYFCVGLLVRHVLHEPTTLRRALCVFQHLQVI